MYVFAFYNQCHLDDCLFVYCIFALRRGKKKGKGNMGLEGPVY